MRELLAKFGLDKHHVIERFGVLFIAALMFVIGTGISGFIQFEKIRHAALGTTAMYSSSFVTSMSGVHGTVEGVYTNNDKTRGFVLLHYDDIKSISIDAQNYNVYIMGVDNNRIYKEDLKSQMAGCIYLFGNTGYMGIYLMCAEGFESQITMLTVRANNQMANTVMPLTDESYATIDQFNTYVNLGAEGTGHLNFLESNGVLDVTEMYEELVVRPAEYQVEAMLNQQLQDIVTYEAQFEEYTNRLRNQGIIVPERPYAINGDIISYDNNTGLYTLNTDVVAAGAWNLDWQHHSISDGYIDAEIGDMLPVDYFAMKAAEVDEIPFDTSTLVWYRSDGTIWYRVEDGTATTRNINEDIDYLTNLWEEFYRDKVAYQTAQEELINLAYSIHDADSTFTVNNNLNAVVMW